MNARTLPPLPVLIPFQFSGIFAQRDSRHLATRRSARVPWRPGQAGREKGGGEEEEEEQEEVDRDKKRVSLR